jgi:hypothetical protein
MLKSPLPTHSVGRIDNAGVQFFRPVRHHSACTDHGNTRHAGLLLAQSQPLTYILIFIFHKLIWTSAKLTRCDLRIKYAEKGHQLYLQSPPDHYIMPHSALKFLVVFMFSHRIGSPNILEPSLSPYTCDGLKGSYGLPFAFGPRLYMGICCPCAPPDCGAPPWGPRYGDPTLS